MFSIDEAKCIAQTSKAILVKAPFFEGPDGDEVWIPQSQIEDESEVYKKGTEGTLVVSDWLAQQKGWE